MKLTKLLSIIVALSLTACCGEAEAATTIFNLDTIRTGGTPSGSSPWVTVTLTDIEPDLIKMDIVSHLNSSTEFISDIDFHINSPTSLTFGTPTTSGDFQTPKITFKSGDLNLGFTQANSGSGDSRFNANDSITYYLIPSNGVTISSFEAPEAHIQGIDGDISSKVTVPEPSAALLGGIGFLGLLRRRRN